MTTDSRIIKLQKEISEFILTKISDPKNDLNMERKKAQFDINALSIFIYGGTEKLDKKRKLDNIIENEPLLNNSDKIFLSREDRIKRSIQYFHQIAQLTQENGLDEEWGKYIRDQVSEATPLDLHWGMFIPTIKSQGTSEQKDYWIPKSYAMGMFI